MDARRSALAFAENRRELGRAPIPRNQALPEEAFGKLDGDSVLVAVSHGWFFQNHPDPDGRKLDLLKTYFAPRIRKLYPHTNIVVFFDFMASPQSPRTIPETKLFKKCMQRMNSIYVYCDVCVFLECPMPDIDVQLHSASVVPANYSWKACGRDIVQILKRKQGSFVDDGSVRPTPFDVVEEVSGIKIDADMIPKLEVNKQRVDIRFLKRPYGLQNSRPNDERGWLFLERITIAIKAAAAPKESFRSIVLSNSESLCISVFRWSDQLRQGVRRNKTELRKVLEDFHGILK
eukprot:g827.t1